MLWHKTHKGDTRCRLLADQHYTRQSPGHPMWTRPGYNYVLYYEDGSGGAVFCWWRPKWESGRKALQRFDGLYAIECTIFRNETNTQSSDLIREACAAVQTWERALDVEWPDGLITGISSKKTEEGRSNWHPPGWCFRKAGFKPFDHKPGRADVWLRCEALPTPAEPRD